MAEVKMKVSVKTRKLKLTAIQSYFRYVQMQMPKQCILCRDILSISIKKCDKKPQSHLSDVEVKMLVAETDIHTKKGIRVLTIMVVVYDSSAKSE